MLKKYFKLLGTLVCVLALSALVMSFKIWAETKVLNVPQGKSVLLDSENLKTNEFKWQSSDPNIATIDTNVDCAYAKNQGQTDVVLKDNQGKILSEYKIIVMPPEKLRITYVSNLNPKVNSNINLFAITDLDVENIRFVLGKNTGEQVYIYPKNKEIDENTLVWTADLLVDNNVSNEINCEYLHSGTWTKTDKVIKLLKINENAEECSSNYRLPSLNCIEFIAKYEGFLKRLRKDPVSGKHVYDIGYGHLATPNEPLYNNITPIYGKALLYNTICNKEYTKDLNEFLINNKIKFNQQQFDALVSFCYNLGTRWLKSSNLKNILLDTENASGQILGRVNYKSGIRIRKMPSFSGEIITAIPFNEEVEILNSQKYEDDWYKVKTKTNIEGFCFSEGIDVLNKKAETKYTIKNTATVTYRSGIRIRKDPSLSGVILKAIPCGEKVEVLDLNKQNNSWYKIRTSSGLVGFCFEEGLRLEQEKIYAQRTEPQFGRSLENINRENFSNEFLSHCHANKKVLKGLLYRRIDELEIFFFNDYQKDGNLNKYGIKIPESLKL